MKTTTRNYLLACIATLLLLACAVLSESDYDDALLAEKAYCEDVAAGVHLNFDELECEKWN